MGRTIGTNRKIPGELCHRLSVRKLRRFSVIHFTLEVEEAPLRLGKRAREAVEAIEEAADVLDLPPAQTAAIRKLFTKKKRAPRKPGPRKKREKASTAKTRLLASLRTEKRSVQTAIRTKKTQLRRIERDIRSLTGRRKRRKIIFRD